MVAGLQHALRAEHFEALVVAVGGTARGVDLRQLAAGCAQRHRGCVGVVRLRRDRRIGQGAGGRINRLGFFAEDPAEDVEVVNQHVLEDAARALQVFDRWRARVAADH